MLLIAHPIPKSKARAAMVAKTVTITLSRVVVEHPHPKALVRSSKRSAERGQMPSFDTGSTSDDAGTQVALNGHHPQPCLSLIQEPQS